MILAKCGISFINISRCCVKPEHRSEQDAPTRIRVGSHLDVAKILEPEDEKGLSFMELAKYWTLCPNEMKLWLPEKRASCIYATRSSYTLHRNPTNRLFLILLDNQAFIKITQSRFNALLNDKTRKHALW